MPINNSCHICMCLCIHNMLRVLGGIPRLDNVYTWPAAASVVSWQNCLDMILTMWCTALATLVVASAAEAKHCVNVKVA